MFLAFLVFLLAPICAQSLLSFFDLFSVNLIDKLTITIYHLICPLGLFEIVHELLKLVLVFDGVVLVFKSGKLVIIPLLSLIQHGVIFGIDGVKLLIDLFDLARGIFDVIINDALHGRLLVIESIRDRIGYIVYSRLSVFLNLFDGVLCFILVLLGLLRRGCATATSSASASRYNLWRRRRIVCLEGTPQRAGIIFLCPSHSLFKRNFIALQPLSALIAGSLRTKLIVYHVLVHAKHSRHSLSRITSLKRKSFQIGYLPRHIKVGIANRDNSVCQLINKLCVR